MELILSAEARREVKAAAAYYEEEVEGLGKAFISALRAGLNHVQDHPEASVVVRGKYRRHIITRFPFGIIYRIDGETIFVAAVMHQRRKSGYWLGGDFS